MNLQESIRRILREELSPRVRRRIDPDEMEKEFLESFESAYDLTKRRRILRAHFLDELIYTTISMMMEAFHWRFDSTLPEDEFWYDDIHTELENHYRDRIAQMYNERQGINESILKEETEVPAFLRRRFSSEDLDWLVNDVKELIDYGESLDTAIYDGTREFIKSRKFPDIYEFGPEADYWESYLRYEKPIVDYVKKKLRITDNVNESVLREELSPRVKRRIGSDEMEKEFLESFDSAYRLTKDRKVLRAHFLDELIYTTISIMMDGYHWRFVSTLPEDEFWYDDIHAELENHYRDRIIQMYNERQGINESILREEKETEFSTPFKRRLGRFTSFVWDNNVINYPCDFENFDSFIHGIHAEVMDMVSDGSDTDGPLSDWLTYIDAIRYIQRYMSDDLKEYYNRECVKEKSKEKTIRLQKQEQNETISEDERIVCEKCEWSWDLSDGGNDPYTCHKCGHTNENDLTEYSRTLKNERIQGSGLRFPKSVVKNNPLRFRPYNREMVEEDTQELTEKCWSGYTQKGMKTMFGKRYPNCVKKKKK